MSKLPAHALIATIGCASAEKAQRFKEILTPLIKHSYENEPKTLTYYFCLPAEAEKKTYKALELYENRSALEDVHFKSSHFQNIPGTVQKEELLGEAGMNLEHATPIAGFLTRPGAPNHGNNPNAYIWTGKFVTQPGKAEDLIEALKNNLPYIEKSEPETISFLVLKGTEPDTVYVWERYSTESALRDVHHKSAGYAKLRETTGPFMKTRDINGFHEAAGFLTKEGGIV